MFNPLGLATLFCKNSSEKLILPLNACFKRITDTVLNES